MNLASIIDSAAADSTAVIDGSVRITYGELRDRVARTAGALRSAGLDPGDQVVVLAGNEPAFIIGVLAAWHAGLGAVLINHQEPAPQLRTYLGGLETQAILCGTGRPAVEAAVDLREAGFGPKLVATPAGCSATDVDEADAEAVPIADADGSETALYIFTSGVSGLPKPAILTHSNLAATHAALAAREETRLSDGSVSLAALPLVHILGLNVAVLSTLRSEGTIVLQSHWNAEQAVDLIEAHAIDTLVLVPTMWSDLAEVPAASPAIMRNVRLARCGAATLTPDVATRVYSNLGVELSQGYGLTETAGTVMFETNALANPGSIGTPLDHVEIRIIDQGADAEPGDPGEIWIKGDCVFGGYWGHDDLNAEAFTDDGWYRTGDIGVCDGRYYLVGREKEMISVSGFKISPVEVELTLEAHPSVSASLVVGEPDDRTGERVVAYVVPADGAEVDEPALQDHVRDSLARYKVPKQVFAVANLPANVIGKRIRRREVLAQPR